MTLLGFIFRSLVPERLDKENSRSVVTMSGVRKEKPFGHVVVTSGVRAYMRPA